MESNPSGLTIRRTLAETTARLRETPSTTPRLDAEIIVGAVLQRSRTDLLVHDDKPVDSTALNAIETLVERRCQGWPIAYLTGRRGFRDFDLQVGPGVLVPRPETETLVELVTAWIQQKSWPVSPEIIDVGTGSGAIALSLAETLADLDPRVVASDVSSVALAYAAKNRDEHPHLAIDLVLGDLLTWLGRPVDVIVANLPYLRPDQVTGNWELAVEPCGALVSGEDGLDLVNQLLDQATNRIRPGGLIALELDPGNIHGAAELATSYFPSARTRIERDLADIDRFLLVELPMEPVATMPAGKSTE